MKNILVFIIMIWNPFTSGAQSFTTQYGDSSTAWHKSSPGDMNVNNYIMNNSSGPIWIKWRITANDITTGWLFKGFCDNMLCYGENAVGLLDGTTSRVSLPYVPGQFGDFHAIFNGDAAPNGSASWIEVLAEDTANNHSDTLVFIARKGPLGVEQVKPTAAITIFPNPAADHVNVLHHPSMKVTQIQVISTSGTLISAQPASGNTTRLSLNQLPPGLYFVRLKGEESRTITTLRLSHY